MESNLNLNDLSIRVLILEDSYPDAELIKHELSEAGYQLTITHTIDKASFSEVLQKEQFDIILSDFNLPAFDAFRALALCQEICPKIPFICVSGSIGEEVAIDLLKKGAVDYVMKDRLARLPFSIQRALEEVVEKEARYKADYELKISEEKFRNIFQNHAAVKLIIDPDNGNILEANNSAAEFYGWPVETLKKMSIKQINSTPFADLKKGFKLAKTGKKTSFEWVHKKANGSKADVEVFSSGIQIGHKYFLHSIIHDISDRKKAEDKIKLLNRAIESSSVSVFITDANGFIIYVNPFFTELTGYTFEEVKGKNPRLLKSGHNSEEFYEDFWNTIQSGKDWIGEFRNRKKNGDLYWEKAVISPILNTSGTITNYVAIKEDITERKAMLDELVIARNKAEESDQLKSAFLTNMSHEIRTPMNGILGFANLLKKPELSGEEQQRYIQIIEKSGARMLNIINDIVSISKIESGNIDIHLSEMNINKQLQFVYDSLIIDANNKNLSLSFNCNLPEKEAIIKTDKEKFYGILTNLVKNAIKYTDEGKVAFGYTLNEKEIEFYVKDTGIGIPKEKQETIFERFIQADIADKMARQGAGLGLAISKAYVEYLNGRIWVESHEGKGSTFFFTLPRNSKENLSNYDSNITENITKIPDFSNLKVLIVEDDQTSELLLSIELGNFCREILKANTGIDAVETCRKNPDIDLILMDIQMPKMNGYQATREIRKFNKKVIIIAQTAFALLGDKEKAIEVGCNDYISKPINKEFLIEKLEIYLQKNNKLA